MKGHGVADEMTAPEIVHLLNILEKELDSTSTTLSELETRLEPVCRREPSSAGPPSERPGIETPLGETIVRKIDVVESIKARINECIRRLEI